MRTPNGKPGWTTSGRIRLLVIGEAIVCEQKAVLAEEAGKAERVEDLIAMARELRMEAEQDPIMVRAGIEHMREPANQWRREFTSSLKP